MTGTIGIVANPSSGKDVRRLVARASVFDNQEKRAIIRRAIEGAIGAGATAFAYVADSHGITQSAIAELESQGARSLNITRIDGPQTASALDTTKGAQELKDQGVVATLILGGDGTSRAFVKGWRDATLLPLSTGTNNIFPVLAEATIAGAALGVLAYGRVTTGEVSNVEKIIDIDIEDEASDLALIDAVITNDRFVGSRALLEDDSLQDVLLTRAEPDGVGMTSLGGLLRPVSRDEDCGLYIQIGGDSRMVHAPIAPGLYKTVGIKLVRTHKLGQAIRRKGPCVLAFDGERERVIGDGQKVSMTISRSGPRVIDIKKTMQLAAERQLFVKKQGRSQRSKKSKKV